MYRILEVYEIYPPLIIIGLFALYIASLTLQRLKHVGFLNTITSKYTRKHIRLIIFFKTFTTKQSIDHIDGSIRLMSKPFYLIYIAILLKFLFPFNLFTSISCSFKKFSNLSLHFSILKLSKLLFMFIIRNAE